MQKVAEAEGKPVPTSYADFPDLNSTKCVGHTGQIRASHRKVRAPHAGDEQNNLSWPGWPFHPHDEPLPGTIAEIETGIWPISMNIRQGEALRLDLTPVKKELFDFLWRLKEQKKSSNKRKQVRRPRDSSYSQAVNGVL